MEECTGKRKIRQEDAALQSVFSAGGFESDSRFPHRYPGRPVDPKPPKLDPRQLQLTFGRVLRRRRLVARIGQEALADEAGLHRTHVSLLERGGRMPTLFVVAKLAAALGTTMGELLTEVETAEPGEEPPATRRGRPPGSGRAASPAGHGVPETPGARGTARPPTTSTPTRRATGR